MPDDDGSFEKGKCLTSFKGKLALTMLGEQPYGIQSAYG